MNKYNEASAIRSLSKKKGSISINAVDKIINVAKDATNVGNGSWGKIDYLCKVHGYIYVFVKSLSKANKNIADEDIKVNTKIAKRERKLDMAKMVKNTMRDNKK